MTNDLYIDNYLSQASKIAGMIDKKAVQNMVNILLNVRQSSGR